MYRKKLMTNKRWHQISTRVCQETLVTLPQVLFLRWDTLYFKLCKTSVYDFQMVSVDFLICNGFKPPNRLAAFITDTQSREEKYHINTAVVSQDFLSRLYCKSMFDLCGLSTMTFIMLISTWNKLSPVHKVA